MTREQLIEKYKNENFTIWCVSESNPYYSSSDNTYFFDEYDAESYYDECCNRQGGRSGFDDDNGGMDYSLDGEDVDIKELFECFDDYEVFEFLEEDFNRE